MDKGALYYFTVIANRNMKDPLVKALSDNGVKLLSATFGHGAAKSNQFLIAMGFVVEHKKVVITGLVKGEHKLKIFEMLARDFGFDKPNTGIAYSIEVEKLSF